MPKPVAVMKKGRTQRSQLLTAQQVMDRLLADPHFRLRGITCSLPAIRQGEEWRFLKSDLEEWIRRQKQSEGERAS